MEFNESWLQLVTIVVSNLVVVLTFFGISISLHNRLREEIGAIRIETGAIKDEMKDFHGRLCTLEERYYNWLMREK